MNIFKCLAFSTLLAVSVSGANAQDFDKGFAAYNVGDFQTALTEFLPLAESGDAGAQYLIGQMYLFGKGVIRSDVEAIKWYKLAADHGNLEVQKKLGFFYEMGVFVVQSDVEAAKWYKLAADQGDGDAQVEIGFIYSKGKGVTQSYVEAAKWYRLAADQGNVEGQTFMGYMYDKGKGVIQDHVRSHMWFNIASANGDPNSANWRDEIAAKMTREDISKAQAMAQECMSSGYKNCGD